MTRDEAFRRHHVTDSGGDGPPLVFAHGFGCDQNVWRLVAPAFERTHRVLRFDHVGCGRSDARAFDPKRHATLDGYAQDVVGLLDALDLEDVAFVGHSVSGMIGALASIQRPARFQSLVMLGPSPRYLNDPPDYHGGFEMDDVGGLIEMLERNLVGWADYLSRAVAGPGADDAAAELKASFCSGDPAMIRSFAAATFLADNRADLPKVPVPSLIVQMVDDAVAPMDVGYYCHRHLRRSVLRTMPISGHAPQLTHPQQTIDVIRDHLNAMVTV